LANRELASDNRNIPTDTPEKIIKPQINIAEGQSRETAGMSENGARYKFDLNGKGGLEAHMIPDQGISKEQYLGILRDRFKGALGGNVAVDNKFATKLYENMDAYQAAKNADPEAARILLARIRGLADRHPVEIDSKMVNAMLEGKKINNSGIINDLEQAAKKRKYMTLDINQLWGIEREMAKKFPEGTAGRETIMQTLATWRKAADEKGSFEVPANLVAYMNTNGGSFKKSQLVEAGQADNNDFSMAA